MFVKINFLNFKLNSINEIIIIKKVVKNNSMISTLPLSNHVGIQLKSLIKNSFDNSPE